MDSVLKMMIFALKMTQDQEEEEEDIDEKNERKKKMGKRNPRDFALWKVIAAVAGKKRKNIY